MRWALRPKHFSPILLLASGLTTEAVQDAIDIAVAQIGEPYAFGANGPDEFDCSGLVEYSYAQVGVTIPRTVAEQAATGSPVSGPLQRGDLLFFATDDTQPGLATHVGIFEGGSTMIHAPRTGRDVSRTDIAAAYWANRFLGGRRLSLNPSQISFAFTGIVTFVSDSTNILAGTVLIGTSVSGTFSYDTNATDLNPNPLLGDYQFISGTAIISIALYGPAGPVTVSTDPQASIATRAIVINDSGFDRFQMVSYGSSGTWGLPFRSQAGIVIDLADLDPPLTFLASDRLPLMLDLSQVGPPESLINSGTGFGGFYNVRFKITNLTRVRP